jgi:Ca-activated chloride channel family protein
MGRLRLRLRQVIGLVLFLVTTVAAAAQSTSSGGPARIEGTVVDEAGAMIPGANVQLLIGNKQIATAISDVNGKFNFAGLAPGKYTVGASLSGFMPATQDIALDAGRTASVTLTLRIAGVSETVSVTSSAPVLNTSRSVAAVSAAGGARRAFNREQYAAVQSNDFRSAKKFPLSTFSVDVDTASYANARRFVLDGELPPPEAVRLEEFINYFEYDYPDPTGDVPVHITTQVARCPWNTQHRLALIGLQAKRIENDAVPPRNLVFLLDVSGSMKPENKLPLVVSSMQLLVDQLRPQDRVAIVVYAGASGLALPSTAGAEKERIRQALLQLHAGGSTNGAEGIELAYRVAQDHFVKDGINRVILATDGDFNVGVTSQGALTKLIEKKRESGIFLSVLGVGEGNLQDATMEMLADKGNGNYAYLDSLQEAHKVLVQQAGSTLVTVAKDVKLQVEFNPATVEAYRLIGYENRLLKDEDFNDDRKDAGDMGYGHSVTALYEIVPKGQPIVTPPVDALKYQQGSALSAAATMKEMATVKIRYKEPAGHASRKISAVINNTDTDAAMSETLGFAAAAAELGMLLQDSAYKGQATYANVLDLARHHRGADPHGYRAEFIRLVELSKTLAAAKPRESRDSASRP